MQGRLTSNAEIGTEVCEFKWHKLHKSWVEEEITQVSYLWTLGMNSLKTIIAAVGLKPDG